MHEITLTLYGTSGCHLCDNALVEINKALEIVPRTSEVILSEVDIVDDDNLFELYQTSIPVLKIACEEHCRTLCWPFNQALVEATIREVS